MSKSIVITARVDALTATNLDALAARLDRSRAWIVAKAVTQLVEAETAFHDYLRPGEEAIARGDSFSQEEMEDWAAQRIRARSTRQAAE